MMELILDYARYSMQLIWDSVRMGLVIESVPVENALASSPS
jgi:hypothetical protein